MKKKFITIVLLIMSKYTLWAQSPDWVLVPKSLNFTAAVTINTMPGTYTTPYYAANCGYDNNGNILFYIVDGKVYDKMGVTAGNLSSAYGINNGRDIIIIPDPGDCTAHLIIHSSADIIVGGSCNYIKKVLCTRITHTGTVLTIQQNYSSLSDIVDCHDLSLSMCVSRPQTNGTRFLYATGNDKIYKYLISSAGISLVSSFIHGLLNSPSDMELSPTGDKVAWSNAAGGNAYSICWVNLDANGDFLNLQRIDATTALYPAYGLEFIDNTKVMVTAGSGTNGGIYEANLTSSPTSVLKINNSAYYYSNLEKALDGKIYAANGTGLLGIDPLYNTSIISTTIGSNVNGYKYYSLPKQLDYENYSQVFSCSPTCLSHVVITGSYTQTLTESQDWIKTNGTTTIPTGTNVKLDADPTTGYIELNPGFESQTGSVFIAQALDGCGPGVPIRHKKNYATQIHANNSSVKIAGTESKLIAYPNPTPGIVNIRHSNTIKELQVFDMMGKMIMKVSTNDGTLTQIDLSKESNGIYIVKAEGVALQKIIKQ